MTQSEGGACRQCWVQTPTLIRRGRRRRPRRRGRKDWTSRPSDNTALRGAGDAGDPEGPPEREQGSRQPVQYFQLLSSRAAIGPYLTDATTIITAKQMLVVQQQRATVAPPPVRQVPAQIKELWKNVRKASEWKHPRAPTVRLLFRDERATPAVLCIQFLQDTKVGRTVTLTPQIGRAHV